MDIATPHPDTPKPNPKPFKPAGTPFPANAKHGDHPQMGVVGGVPHAEKTTGTPGAAHLGVKPHTPQPPYPYQARAAHLTGSGSVPVTFDGSGHASSVSVSQSVGSGILDNNTVQFAKANWTGRRIPDVMCRLPTGCNSGKIRLEAGRHPEIHRTAPRFQRGAVPF